MSASPRPSFESLPVPPEICPAEGVEHPDLRAVLAHWNEARAGRDMPAKSDISLRAIQRQLKFIHFYDLVDGGKDFRFRVIGSAVFTGLAQDQTGRLVSEHPDAGIALRFGMLLKAVVEGKKPVRGVANRITGNKLYDFHIESLWLPLGTNGAIDQVIGVSSYKPFT